MKKLVSFMLVIALVLLIAAFVSEHGRHEALGHENKETTAELAITVLFFLNVIVLYVVRACWPEQ